MGYGIQDLGCWMWEGMGTAFAQRVMSTERGSLSDRKCGDIPLVGRGRRLPPVFVRWLQSAAFLATSRLIAPSLVAERLRPSVGPAADRRR